MKQSKVKHKEENLTSSKGKYLLSTWNPLDKLPLDKYA